MLYKCQCDLVRWTQTKIRIELFLLFFSKTQDFIKLNKLRTIDLTANKLQMLNGTEFTKATNLAHLKLSNNSGIADSNVIFGEMSKNLNNLDLANCNIMQLSDNIFENIPSLIVLDLRDNPLESVSYEFKIYSGIKSIILYISALIIYFLQNLNSEAFKYLVKLRTLRISSVAEENVLNLCKSLESIDLINMDKYDLSCFELSAGSTFDESTIKAGQSTFIIDTDSKFVCFYIFFFVNLNVCTTRSFISHFD